MNAYENAVENYHFSLRELRQLATDNLPNDISEFLDLLALQARNKIEGETFKRQTEQEQIREYKSE